RNTNPLRQIMDPAFHSSSLNTRRLIYLGRTAAKSLCTTRMAAVKFLFEALCVWPQFGFQQNYHRQLLPRLLLQQLLLQQKPQHAIRRLNITSDESSRINSKHDLE
ncbi:hypothetical protein P5673_011076, partial [Acropora cervicornis]